MQTNGISHDTNKGHHLVRRGNNVEIIKQISHLILHKEKNISIKGNITETIYLILQPTFFIRLQNKI